MADFYSLRDAMFVTPFPVARMVYQSSWEADALAEMLKFKSITDGTAQVVYARRKTGDKISTDWIVPGQVIQPAADPKIVEVVTRLRIMTKQPKVPSHQRDNYNSAMGTYSQDPLMKKVFLMLKDLARGIWDTAINGVYIDTAKIVAGGGLTSANILATGTVIAPGPYNDPQRGQGALDFSNVRKALRFKSPGDNDFGDWVPFNPGDRVTLRSQHIAGYITLTTAASYPSSDANCLIEFSSSTQQPDGLVNLVDPSQIMSNATPTAINFSFLDQLITKLNPAYRDNPMTCYVMHSREINALKDRARQFGGAKLEDKPFGDEMRDLPEFMGMAPKMVPHYSGHPILVNDRIPDTILAGRAVHPIYLVCLDPEVMEDAETESGGFYGITRGTPDGAVMQGTSGMGFQIKDIGTLQNETSDAMRITWEGAWCLGSSGAAAKYENFWQAF